MNMPADATQLQEESQPLLRDIIRHFALLFASPVVPDPRTLQVRTGICVLVARAMSNINAWPGNGSRDIS